MALDQDVVNLAKAIRQHESGNKAQLPGEGAELGGKSLYQYTHGTWKSVAGKYLGDQNAQLTRENENKATYLRIADWKKQGYNPAQIASMWNAGPGRPNAYKENWRGVNKYGVKFDTPAYVAKVYETYKQEKAKTTPPQPTQQPQLAQPAQPQVPVQKKSFFDKFADTSGKVLSAGANMLGIPALIENLASIGEAGAYGVNKLLGREQQAQQILDNPISAPQKMAATQGTAAGIKNALGNTIEAGLGASVLATGGLGATAKGTQVATKAPGFLKTIGTGAKLGAGYGAGFGVAEGLKQNLDTPSIIGEGIKSGVTGGILGGGLGIAGYGLSKVAGKVATSAAAKKAGISTKEMGNIAKVEEELYNIENNYAKLRKVNQFEKDAGAASRRRIAESNVLAGSIDENGRIITKSIDGPIERYKNATIGEYENLVGKLLEKEGAKVTPAFIAKKLQDTLMKSGLEGNALKTALSRIESEVQGLMLRADQNGLIPLSSVHYAKIATTKGINYATEPFVAAERKAIARAYKELVEQVSKENIKPINKEIQKYLKDIKLLENLDGKIVKGGKLGKYFSQIAGNLSGAAVGGAIGGPLGMVSGTVAGGEIASRIKGKTIQGILGRGQFKAPKKSEVLQKALNEAETRVKVTQKGTKQRVPVEVMPEDRPGRLLPPPRPKVNVLPKGNVIQVGAPKSAGEKTKESVGILAKRLKESNVKSAGAEPKGGQKYYSGRNGDMATAENTGMYGNGAYLTSDVKRAKLYGETIDEFSVEGLKLYEPKDTIKELFGRDTNYGDSALITKKYKDLGYDGLKIGSGKDKEIVVFDPKKLNKQPTSPKQGLLSRALKDKPGFIGQDSTSQLIQGAKPSQLAITPKVRENPAGFFKMALDANVPEEIKPVLVQAFGNTLDRFKSISNKSKLVDVRAGVEYMKKNNISFEDLYNISKKELSKPAALKPLEATIKKPSHIIEIDKKINQLLEDPDTTPFESQVLEELSANIEKASFSDFKQMVNLIKGSEINNYIKNELTDIVVKYQKKADKLLPANSKMGLSIEDVSPKGKGEILKPGFIGEESSVPLAQEARKYKSSKEFIEALDINYRDSWKGNKDKDADRLLALFDGKVFHGTNAADEIIKKGYKKGNYFNSGAYFSDMPDEAIGYMKQGRSSGGKSSSVLVNDLSNLKIKMQEGTDGDIIRKINKLEPGIEEYVLKLKKQGYDGIKSRWGETLVWNTQKIKTPERLEDIWEQASKGSKEFPVNKPLVFENMFHGGEVNASRPVFYSQNKAVAESYGKVSKPEKIVLQKPLVIDFSSSDGWWIKEKDAETILKKLGVSLDDLDKYSKSIGLKNGHARKVNALKTDHFVAFAKDNGYDGVVFKNALDYGSGPIKGKNIRTDNVVVINNKQLNNKPGYIGSDFARNKEGQKFGKTGAGMLIKGAAAMGATAVAPIIYDYVRSNMQQKEQLKSLKEKIEPAKEPEKPKTKDEEIEDYVKNIKVTINKKGKNLGNTLAEDNNNPGNLKFAGQPNAKKNGAYAQFPTPELGFRALIKDVQSKQKKGLTLEEMMNIYAPPEENDTEAYLDALEGWLNVKRTDKASEIDPIELAKRIAQFESQTVIE